jgi:hypothetical protein
MYQAISKKKTYVKKTETHELKRLAAGCALARNAVTCSLANQRVGSALAYVRTFSARWLSEVIVIVLWCCGV